MSVNSVSLRSNFGLLPEPERRPASFLTSALLNLAILGFCLYAGLTAKHVLEQHKYEQTLLIFPTQPTPPLKMKLPPPPKVQPPAPSEAKLQPPKINRPRVELKPDLKPIQMEAKVETQQVKTTAAIGSPYGGMNGFGAGSRGVVGSTGIGSGTAKGASFGNLGKVASAGIPGMTTGAPVAPNHIATSSTNLEIVSKPQVKYTPEARQLRIEGEVVLRVTFSSTGQVTVRGVVRGLGHGLDEEARRVAEQIRFRPATVDGHPADMTTNITITFQLA